LYDFLSQEETVKTMINSKSKNEEIFYYIEQLKLLMMSEEEFLVINKILSLEKILKDDKVKDLIAEDLKDESWIEATKVLLQTCYKRSEKSVVIGKRIQMCEGLLIFKYLEDKLKTSKLLTLKFIDGKWSFYDAGRLWVNSKFSAIFNQSSVAKDLFLLKGLSPLQDELQLTSELLYINRDVFFTSELFEDVNIVLMRNKAQQKTV